jgi:hypothetical protein
VQNSGIHGNPEAIQAQNAHPYRVLLLVLLKIPLNERHPIAGTRNEMHHAIFNVAIAFIRLQNRKSVRQFVSPMRSDLRVVTLPCAVKSAADSDAK